MLPRIIRPGEQGYRRCTVTVMDTTDPEIRFNAAGECHYVDYYRRELLTQWDPQGDRAKLDALCAQIRADGRGREYDCVLGLSGGVDSSYLAYLAWQQGLRPLVVHTDTGWNSELAVRNIENIVRKCGFDLFTVVVYWPEMQDLQRAFFRAAVPNQDIPQDHAITAAFYRLATKHGIPWALSGSNFACESILPTAWGYDARDLRHIKAIHRLFGERPLKRYPQMGYVRYVAQLRSLQRLKVAKLLNLIPYRKRDAIELLTREFGWRYYGGKHYESRFTKFFQGWYLPGKFGYDKRLAHLSSLILAGEITRDEALAGLERELYSAHELRDDKLFMQKKLGVPPEEFDRLMAMPARAHNEYPSSQRILTLVRSARGVLNGRRAAA
jgi:N-acetyl sugar amidotransferase